MSGPLDAVQRFVAAVYTGERDRVRQTMDELAPQTQTSATGEDDRVVLSAAALGRQLAGAIDADGDGNIEVSEVEAFEEDHVQLFAHAYGLGRARAWQLYCSQDMTLSTQSEGELREIERNRIAFGNQMEQAHGAAAAAPAFAAAVATDLGMPTGSGLRRAFTAYAVEEGRMHAQISNYVFFLMAASRCTAPAQTAIFGLPQVLEHPYTGNGSLDSVREWCRGDWEEFTEEETGAGRPAASDRPSLAESITAMQAEAGTDYAGSARELLGFLSAHPNARVQVGDYVVWNDSNGLHVAYSDAQETSQIIDMGQRTAVLQRILVRRFAADQGSYTLFRTVQWLVGSRSVPSSFDLGALYDELPSSMQRGDRISREQQGAMEAVLNPPSMLTVSPTLAQLLASAAEDTDMFADLLAPSQPPPAVARPAGSPPVLPSVQPVEPPPAVPVRSAPVREVHPRRVRSQPRIPLPTGTAPRVRHDHDVVDAALRGDGNLDGVLDGLIGSEAVTDPDAQERESATQARYDAATSGYTDLLDRLEATGDSGLMILAGELRTAWDDLQEYRSSDSDADFNARITAFSALRARAQQRLEAFRAAPPAVAVPPAGTEAEVTAPPTLVEPVGVETAEEVAPIGVPVARAASPRLPATRDLGAARRTAQTFFSLGLRQAFSSDEVTVSASFTARVEINPDGTVHVTSMSIEERGFSCSGVGGQPVALVDFQSTLVSYIERNLRFQAISGRQVDRIEISRVNLDFH